MGKKIFAAVVFLFALFGAFADDTDDLDDLFSDAEDTEAVVTEKPESTTVVAQIGNFSLPLSWSGYLESSIGGGYVREDGSGKSSGYFTFLNYLYLNARPDKTLSLHGALRTDLPGGSVLSVYELYFTYLLFDSVFISAGRKATSWGYVRLIGTVDDDDDKNDTVSGSAYKYGGVSTNILSDSRGGTSGLVRVPLWTGTISAWAFYSDNYGTSSSMDSDKMSFALSVEETLWNTSINLFARKYPNALANSSDKKKFNEVGLELKRTVLDADIYAQGIGQVKSASDIVKKHDINGFYEIVFTAGLYKWWDKHDPNFGFNLEFQEVYFPATANHNRCIAYDAGFRRLGRRHNIKIGVSGYHSILDKNGYIKPGIILSGIFPHANWENGVRIDYGESSEYVSPKFTLGSYLKISLNY